MTRRPLTPEEMERARQTQPVKPPMGLGEAMALVLEMARDNSLARLQADTPALRRQRARQRAACNIVEDFIANQVLDGREEG